MNGFRGLHRVVRPLIGCLMILSLVATALPAGAASPPLYARPTGHTIPAAFRPLWEQLGGVDGLGWPLDEVQAVSGGQQQWFEYGRIVQNGNNPPELAVVGREAAQFGSLMNFPAFKSVPKPGNTVSTSAYYSAKFGHWTANGLFTLWNTKHNPLGDPISEGF